jgi:hypothetical protein
MWHTQARAFAAMSHVLAGELRALEGGLWKLERWELEEVVCLCLVERGGGGGTARGSCGCCSTHKQRLRVMLWLLLNAFKDTQ